MKKFLPLIITIISFVLVMTGTITKAQSIPQYFTPNYEIDTDRQTILDTFVQIEAQKKVGQMPDSHEFEILYNSFNNVFPRLPQQSKYKIVYEQCKLLTQQLATNDYNYYDFSNFVDNCYSDLQKVIKEINAQYTVQPKITVQPSVGSAPLTVTFDARESIDPSNDTIPSDNFFRRYKDINGIDREIGKGSVVNYKFTEEGNYYVHMTVRSANHTTEGILDGTKTFTVNVSPRTALLSVYANGQKMFADQYIKIGNKEAKNGVEIDGSSTIPKGGRKILHHYRRVRNNNNFSYKTEQKNGKPGTINVTLPDNGEYTVTLTTIDNENNTISQDFLLKVSDPIATIVQEPKEGNTQTTFTFDGGKSYSIQSRLALHTWEIFDDQGEKIYTTQEEKIDYQFKKPGVYTVKLSVTDEIGETDQESVTLSVKSSSPIAQFTIEPTSQWKYPSQFILNANKTTDPDVTNGFDTLTYQRSFSNKDIIEGAEGFETQKQPIVSFNEKGTYTVSLTVTDAYGETNTIDKEIKIDSSVRPEIVAFPKATTRGNTITFAVKSNKKIINYDWDFGDNTTRIIQEPAIKHKYDKAGTYIIKLNATTKGGETNSITTEVFIGEKDAPIAVYNIKNIRQTIMQQKATCVIDQGKDKEPLELPAYQVDRFEDFTIDTQESVNAKGTNTNLKLYFQPQDGDISTRNNFKYKFSDIGCRYIDIFVEDTVAKKTDNKRIRFKVLNALPTLDEIGISFPQYGNEAGIGFNIQSKTNILSDPKYDPLIVKVEAQGARDPDGSISYYTRYYYDKNNPNNILESRISPASNPYAYFSLPKTIPGEYVFGVRMTDNDGGEIASEEIIGQSAALPFFPDEKNLDIPMVTLIADRINIKAGDEVTFTVKSKILSQRKDFDAQKTNKFDFDGDGKFDLITKDDTVTHIYKEPNTDGIVPRVEVMYRGYKGSARGEKITIKNGLKPIVLFSTIGKTLLFRDNSIGAIKKRRLCFDHNLCKVNEDFITTKGNAFTFTYPDYGTYVIEYSLRDDYGNTATERHVITLTGENNNSDIVRLFSLPKASEKDGEYQVTVGKNLANSVLFYVDYKGKGDCYMDINIEYDSDGDGSPDDDKDIICNTANKLVEYDAGFGSAVGKIYYDGLENGIVKTQTKNVTINFLDYEAVLTDEEQSLYNKVTELIKTIDPTITGNKLLVEELLSLRKNVQSKPDIANSVITIYDLMDKKTTTLEQSTENRLMALLESLSNSATVAALGGNQYDQAKQEILSILPENLQIDVKLIFQQIEQVEQPKQHKDKIKILIGNLMSLIDQHTVTSFSEQGTSDILQEDYDLIVHPQLCIIADYFHIETKTCGNTTNIKETANTIAKKTDSGFSSILKRILIVIGIVGILFVGIIVVFAIKGRANNQEKEEDE